MLIRLNDRYAESEIIFDNNGHGQIIIDIDKSDLPFYLNWIKRCEDYINDLSCNVGYKYDIYYKTNLLKDVGIFKGCFPCELNMDEMKVYILFDQKTIEEQIPIRNIKLQKILNRINND